MYCNTEGERNISIGLLIELNPIISESLWLTLSNNNAISIFTPHNIMPLITLATQYKFYDGGK